MCHPPGRCDHPAGRPPAPYAAGWRCSPTRCGPRPSLHRCPGASGPRRLLHNPSAGTAGRSGVGGNAGRTWDSSSWGFQTIPGIHGGSRMTWWTYALLSAVFAAATAILAKVGVEGVPSTLATALRTVGILAFAWGIAFARGEHHV